MMGYRLGMPSVQRQEDTGTAAPSELPTELHA